MNASLSTESCEILNSESLLSLLDIYHLAAIVSNLG